MNRLKSVEFWCFLLLMVNVATAGVDFYFRRSTAALEPFPSGREVSGRLGITVGGSPPESGAACHLVRYASTYCGYCSPKYSEPWNDLEKTLTHKGCDSIIVSPYSGDLPPGDGATPEQKLAGVSLQFIKSTHFTSTPITLLLDRDWKIVWSHIGVVESGDAQHALRLAGF
ncbi:MAG TPA: hypothetical protein VI636_14325 [Candidatus Angelobacter sp.]